MNHIKKFIESLYKVSFYHMNTDFWLFNKQGVNFMPLVNHPQT